MAKRRTETLLDIARERLRSQRLVGAGFARATEVVAWLGAVQAQDYAGAKWGIAQRMKRGADEDLEQVFERGEILRTHVLRPTWHFVLPEDIRFLLELSAPRVKAASAYYWKRAGLDERAFRKSRDVLSRELGGGRHRTRAELGKALTAARLPAAGEALGLLLMRAELDALICSGPRRGKQFTYALLDERAPRRPAQLPRDEGLGALALRYFRSHGPATAHDFAWWAGLTVGDARAGIARTELVERVVEGRRFFELAAAARGGARGEQAVHLLPNYDEHVVAYKDHAATLDPLLVPRLAGTRGVLDSHLIALEGRVIGGWRRSFEQGEAVVQLNALVPLSPAQREALQAALDRYARFLGMAVRTTG